MPDPSVNSWLEDELYHQYLRDRQTVDSGWKNVFESNGQTTTNGAPAVAEPVVERVVEHVEREEPKAPAPGDHLVPLRGPALRIAENMTASLDDPGRHQPARDAGESDRREPARSSISIAPLAGQSKLSYTHLMAWAIVKALEKIPALNQAFSEQGEESFRVTRRSRESGHRGGCGGQRTAARSLKVPYIKNARGDELCGVPGRV